MRKWQRSLLCHPRGCLLDHSFDIVGRDTIDSVGRQFPLENGWFVAMAPENRMKKANMFFSCLNLRVSHIRCIQHQRFGIEWLAWGLSAHVVPPHRDVNQHKAWFRIRLHGVFHKSLFGKLLCILPLVPNRRA